MRHLGRQHGYYPQDDMDEAFSIDWVFETQADFWGTKAYRLFFRPSDNAEEQAEGVAHFDKFN